MRLILQYLLIFITIIFSHSSYALEQRGMLWTGFAFNGPFYKSKWNYNFMNQARLSYTSNVLEQYVIRSSIYYMPTKNWSIWGGYDFIPTRFPNNTSYFFEQRVWPQLQYSVNLHDHFDVTVRSRLELRWRTNAHGDGLWFRQRFEVAYVNFNKYHIDIDVFDEMFFILDHPNWAPRGVIDQNRAYIGLVFPLSQIVAFNLGYLNLYRPHSMPVQMDHVLFAAVEINFAKGGIPVPLQTI